MSSPTIVVPPAAAREVGIGDLPAAGHGQVHVGRQVGGEQAQRLDHRVAGQGVDVVERQHEVVGDGLDELVGQGGDLQLGRAAGGQRRGDAGERLGDAGGDVGDQHLRRPQPRVARQPYRAHLGAVEGLDQQRRLPVARARDERGQAALQAAVHALDQLRTRDAVRRQARRQQPRAEDAGRSGRRRRGCCRRHVPPGVPDNARRGGTIPPQREHRCAGRRQNLRFAPCQLADRAPANWHARLRPGGPSPAPGSPRAPRGSPGRRWCSAPCSRGRRRCRASCGGGSSRCGSWAGARRPPRA